MSSRQWCFADFRLDPDNACLWRGTQTVTLTPKAFDVLQYLVTHPDRLITKDTLLDAVWPETAVSDTVVRIAIGELRRALGDTAQAPQYIATVHRRGYRFLASVTVVDPPETPRTGEPQRLTAQEQTPLVSPLAALPEQRHPSCTGLEDERKQVTVLCAALADSLALIRDLDPETAQQLLDPAVHRMIDAVHRYGGMVNQVLGDGIMALFGAPMAQEDHALRACYAALAMQAALRTYAAEVQRIHGVALHLRVGLHSGEVVVRTLHHDQQREYSAVGQTTHLAARMEQVAAPDTIVLTAATWRLVEGLVRVKALGPVPVEGLAASLDVYELLGTSVLQGRFQAALARGLTRFVGREPALASLHHALARARAGQGQVVAVVGEAGLGKSRLVYECLQPLKTQDWLVLESAAMAYTQATPYGPVVALLKQYFHLEDGEAPQAIQATLTAQVHRLDARLQETVPALLALLDALPADDPFRHLDPVQQRSRILDALKRLLVRASQRHPVVLVIEDVQWLDTETQTWLDRLVDSLPAVPLLLLVNYRPEYHHGWGSKTYYTHLRLDPLPPASITALVQEVLGDDASLAPLLPLLIAHTEGNPFFLEESLRSLVEMQVLVGTRGAYRLGQALPAIRVPATVQAVLAARIDRLPPDDKRVLQTAAVIGMDVPLPVLHAVTALPEAVVQHSLAALQAAEFLYETHLFPDILYTFKHALTQEVAYGGLLQERRRMLHAHIVEAIERLAPERLDEQVERLAHHAVRGEVWDKALRYCRQAGAKAMARAAFHEATAAFEAALAALVHLPESRETREQAIDLRFDLRPPLTQLAAYERLFAHLREAATLAEALEDHRRLGQVCVYMGWYCRLMGDYDRTLASSQRALAIAEARGDVAVQVTARYVLGHVYHLLGDYRRALDLMRRNLVSLAGELRYAYFGLTAPPSVTSRTTLVRCLAELGEFAEGIAQSEAGVRLAEAIGHPTSFIFAYQGVGMLSLLKGDDLQAIAALEHALACCQDAHLLYFFPALASALGVAYARSGRITEALALREQAIQQTAATSRQDGRSRWVAHQSEATLLAGHPEAALALAQQALELTRAHQERGYEAWSRWLLGEIAAQRTPLEVEHTAAHYRQALALAEALGMRPLVAHCHRGLGRLYATTGQGEQACTALSTALTLYRDMDMTFWLPQTEAALTQVERP